MYSFPQRQISHKSFFPFPVSSTNKQNVKNRSRSHPHRRRWSTRSGSSGGFAGHAAGSGSDGQVRLHTGMQVFLSSANEMASVRYVGTADFAPGLWLGLELRSPKGKNDGSVGDHRYFTCRPGHGVLVRPSRVTYCGINGSRLVDEKRWRCLTLLFETSHLKLGRSEVWKLLETKMHFTKLTLSSDYNLFGLGLMWGRRLNNCTMFNLIALTNISKIK